MSDLLDSISSCSSWFCMIFGMAQAPVAQVAAPVAAMPAVEASAPAVVDLSKNPNVLKSPIVGVVYLSPEPSAPDYVKVGSEVKEGDTVCLIEAMKTFNPVKAHKSGKVTQILIETGSPAEYNEPLLVIE